MPYYRRRERRRRLGKWDAALRRNLASVRAQIGLEPDAVIDDAALVAEARQRIGNWNIRAAEQWFGWRLIGMAESEPEQDRLLGDLTSLPHVVPWGLMHGTDSPQRSRRGQTQARRET